MNSKIDYSKEFSWVKLSSKKYKSMIDEALQKQRKVMDQVKIIPAAERTFENTVVPIEYAGQQLNGVWSYIDILLNTKPNKADREEAQKVFDYTQAQSLERFYDEEIYQAFLAVEKNTPNLKGEDKKLFSDAMREYKLMGFNLPKAKRDVFKKKFQEYLKLCSAFSKNINDYQDQILVTKEELDGVNESYIDSLPKQGNKYVVTLDYPSYIPFMENVHNESKRKILFEKYMQKGGKKNIAILEKILKSRKEISAMLGFKNHAEFRLVDRMAKNPETVFKFLNGLIKPVSKKVKADVEVLKRLKQELSGKSVKQLEQHDVLYLINYDKKKNYDVDDQLVREYFPLDVVSKGMFSIYETLLGIKFKENKQIPVWHKDVNAYDVVENTGKNKGKVLAHFFLDLFPREGKYGHAAVFPIIPGLQKPDGSYQKPVVAMVCNFPKPTKLNPSLLSHDQVETYFHEFGHLVHGTLTTAKYGAQSGTSVARDFVEAPSQMLEGWVWNEKTLQLLSGHYKNPKKKLPKDLLKKMLASKNHMLGYYTMRQFVIGMFDMKLHTLPNIKNISGLYAQLAEEHIGIKFPKSQIWPAGFGHLNGYDAGYYGYMWSKVYASDMFTRFEKEGLLNPKTGRDYRTKILEPGSSKEAVELLKDFLGRKPNTKAFLKEIGL